MVGPFYPGLYTHWLALLVASRERGERLLEDLEGLLDLALRHIQRGRDAYDISPEPTATDQEPSLLRLLEEARRARGVRRAILGRFVDHELNRLHEALATNIANDLRVPPLQCLESLAEGL